MILFVAVSIYIPGLFLHPKYNFLYTDGDYYVYNTGGSYFDTQAYLINNGHLVQRPQTTPVYPGGKPNPSPQLYVHNVTTNESTPISFQDAQNLNLNPTVESPDGYTLENGSQSDGFSLFFGYNKDYNSKYLVGHNVSKKLNIKNTSSSYSNSTHFLGWIMQ